MDKYQEGNRHRIKRNFPADHPYTNTEKSKNIIIFCRDKECKRPCCWCLDLKNYRVEKYPESPDQKAVQKNFWPTDSYIFCSAIHLVQSHKIEESIKNSLRKFRLYSKKKQGFFLVDYNRRKWQLDFEILSCIRITDPYTVLSLLTGFSSS